ncbi:DUF3093 domain-containing protein [Cryobacterium sp. TMT1-62]|uniref:DUF3093 domain-containing protein n=1 Tax=Cryobacterium sandaracinum TaxID=1259247 RepID=A0ABY2JJ25_9MICO|nr:MULTISPECIES: DUF3093 domain-containing protein [Cryobacterium]TFB57627.1 DUF3093 domain-containing protein [Cryobacterium sp. Sr3]TFB57872.1 DUF3093 domain-containing protein [Cryobacterium sp. Hz7]TFC34743.1 DUF3093 domain-containing protein [Cryobacterium sp. TMT2-14]TFC48254.1 DUF3093 domain-containing protein [Cryobacterium sp. TMT2-17-1]TFC66379.1 DUF3093 domain-containing protein [Cryobacterium sp. TMT2-4]
MPEYREKLWASPAPYVATALIIPASILVFAPISMLAGVLLAAGLYAACVLALLLSAPVVQVRGGELTAGRASISIDLVGEVLPFDGDEAALERGQRLDARAWLLIRGWIRPVVRIPIVDATDPAPYWLVSTRRPQKLAAAINGSRRPASHD